MGAIPETGEKIKKTSSNTKTIIMIAGIIGAIAALGLVYMTMYTAPEEIIERVKVIAVTESGCIVETLDGFAFNIGQCDAKAGDIIMAPVDQKVKDRAVAMNPS